MLDLGQSAPVHRNDALHIVFQSGKLVMDMQSRQSCILTDSDLQANDWQVAREQYIGHWAGQACFAVEIDDVIDVDAMRYQVGNLYHLLGRVEDNVFALAGRAAQLLEWKRDHRFCGRCGGAMQAGDGDRAMGCGSCKSMLYPRISPCVIVLITRGDEMLLARNARFPRPMYSSLAGFIEAGESAEDTLRREVREEVGVEVGEIQYYGSQSWPFPNQLMLGYFAEYASGEITPDQDEIAEADWYHPQNLPPVPPPSSIAGQLIQYHCRLEPILGLSFGYHILQMGPLPTRSLVTESPINHQIFACAAADGAASMFCHGDELPLESDSVDTVVAFHALEFDEHPHGSLREMQRVLRPHGHLVIVGYNPWSLLGAAHSLQGLKGSSLWNRQRYRPVSLHRLTDWLRLLDCELESAQHLFPVPMTGRGRIRGFIGRVDEWAYDHSLPGGGLYIAHAIKQIAGIRRPRSLRARARESFWGLSVAPSPRPTPRQPRSDNSDLAA